MPVIRDANIINRKESFFSVFLWNYFLFLYLNLTFNRVWVKL